ncbi:MAG TPA: hypothetical protein VFZ65_18405 [Planctomycetota bacterium]|nr:hypothetical protein [Planctomycetota bacterium]
MPIARPLFVLATCLIGFDAAAQLPVVTVGGSNPDFADLPQAVAAAAPESILEVRPGHYLGFTTNKPLHILLDFTAATGSVQAPPGGAYAIQINGLFTGSFSVIGRGATLGAGVLGAIRVANTGAYVMLQGLTVTAPGLRPALDVQNAATVFVERCAFAGTPALQIQDATLAGSNVACTSPAGFAVFASRSLLDLGHGSYRSYQVPAIHVDQCAVRLAGDGATPIVVAGAPTGPVSAFEAIGSLLQWDQSRFQVVAAGGAPGFVNLGGAVFPGDVPTLVTSAASPGGNATVRMTVGAPTPGLIGFDTLGQHFTIYELTGVYVDPVVPVIAALGIVDAGGLSLSVSVPHTATLRGQTFSLQGIVWPPSGLPVWSAPGLWSVL